MSDNSLLKLQNGSDVRGIATEGVEGEHVNLTEEAAGKIALGFVEFLSKKTGKAANSLKIMVGHDSRITAEKLKGAVLGEFIASGVDAYDSALSSTPAMFMSTIFPDTDMDGAVMITASHLPYNRNGLKFFTKDGGAESADITEILKLAEGKSPKGTGNLKAHKYNLIERYSAHLRDKIKDALNRGEEPLKGMHMIVDAGNGAGGFFAEEILKPLGADISGSQFLEPDGMFPNHIPNPENKEAMEAIRSAVLSSKAELGLIFDTDVDRMSAVLPDGEEINRNALIAMMAAILAPDYPGSTIITDSVTSDELTEFLTHKLKLKHHRFKRGYKNVINECIRLNKEGTVSPLAIETSGHGALSENYYLDDGAYLALKLVIAAAKAKEEGAELKSLIQDLKYPAESKEYRIKILKEEGFKEYGAKVLEEFKERAAAKGIEIAGPSYEGVRLKFKTGWALIRLSLHDPVMPLNIESRETGCAELIAGEVKELLKGFDALSGGILE